jgi:hypothetical protein
MADLVLGSTTIMTESGGSASLSSDVGMPSGMLIGHDYCKLEGAIVSGNLYRTIAEFNYTTYSNQSARLSLSSLPKNKTIVIAYHLFISYDNHPYFHIKTSWTSHGSGMAYISTNTNSSSTAGMNWGDNVNKYPLGLGGYDTDQNTVQHVIVQGVIEDTNASNTSLYSQLWWGSQNSTSHVRCNKTLSDGNEHGAHTTSFGYMYAYQN